MKTFYLEDLLVECLSPDPRSKEYCVRIGDQIAFRSNPSFVVLTDADSDGDIRFTLAEKKTFLGVWDRLSEYRTRKTTARPQYIRDVSQFAAMVNSLLIDNDQRDLYLSCLEYRDSYGG